MLKFDYDLDGGGAPVWQSLVQRGGDLLQSLVEEGQGFGVYQSKRR